MTLTAKRLDYAVSVDRTGAARSDKGGDPLEWQTAWSAEHLLLAGLCRCTVTSLRYHAKRANVRATVDASASGVVTQRAADGRYAFVEIDIALDAVLDPPLAGPELRELLFKAERDCFIGASLTTAPRYRWTVEGEEIS
jgi:uncharacterized OsmC-like protein